MGSLALVSILCLDRVGLVSAVADHLFEAGFRVVQHALVAARLAAIRVRGVPMVLAVVELVAALGLSQPTVSKHLRVLRKSGFVRVRNDAQRRIYELDYTPIAELEDWLAPSRGLWNHSLDRLGERLDQRAPTTETL